MTHEPAINLRGALRVLGQHDHKWLDRLNRILGGVLLASGLAPSGYAVKALWGWIDQKEQAATLVRAALDSVSARLSKTSGVARHEMVVASHTIIVVTSFFEAVREVMGDQYDEAALNDVEKVALATGNWGRARDSLIGSLYQATDIPAPSAISGFEENVAAVATWAALTASRLKKFLDGLTADFSNSLALLSNPSFSASVANRYRSNYLSLANGVHEFKVWSDLTEHAATRSAFVRLEQLLTLPGVRTVDGGLRAAIRQLNLEELGQPIIDVDIAGYGIDAVFPALVDIFVTPHFRIVWSGSTSQLGSEYWWSQETKRVNGLDEVLARHFCTASATRLPLLLLGHPGAGKSLLTKMLAARLPASGYTVVRVPLRRVDANANVSEQIHQALDRTTNGRVTWPQLANESADVIRVILLDGLDELLQATSNDRSGYLSEIAEFQRVEAAFGRPVAILITSRTLVVDRVRVPEGTPVVKLEEFDNDQIAQWIRAWNHANEDTSLLPMDLETALSQDELARQPLLLLMLTLYFVDPATARPEAELSPNELYRRLFDTYIHREVMKRADHMDHDEFERKVDAHFVRLAVAALGMFNRGRQWITETELSDDLSALGESAPLGRRLLGEFFFVHTAEAITDEVQRSYEFMHATFNEYLVAARLVDVLIDVAEGAFGRRRPHTPDDDQLFALMSYQTLAIQPPILRFIADQLAALDNPMRATVTKTLDLLIHSHYARWPSNRYREYRPQPVNITRSLAAYTVNLVLLRIYAEPDRRVPIRILARIGNGQLEWANLVNLWMAGLDAEGNRAVLQTLTLVDGRVVTAGLPVSNYSGWLNMLNLIGNYRIARRLRMGHAMLEGRGELPPLDSKDDIIARLIMLYQGDTRSMQPILDASIVPESDRDNSLLSQAGYMIMGTHCVKWSRMFTSGFLAWLVHFPKPNMPSALPLELVERVHPGLIEEVLEEHQDLPQVPKWRELWKSSTVNLLLDMKPVERYLRLVTPSSAVWSLLLQQEDPPPVVDL